MDGCKCLRASGLWCHTKVVNTIQQSVKYSYGAWTPSPMLGIGYSAGCMESRSIIILIEEVNHVCNYFAAFLYDYVYCTFAEWSEILNDHFVSQLGNNNLEISWWRIHIFSYIFTLVILFINTYLCKITRPPQSVIHGALSLHTGKHNTPGAPLLKRCDHNPNMDK